MLEVFKLLIGTGILILGFPIGNILAKYAKEELHSGQKWFKIIIFVGLIGGLIGLVVGNDALLFSMFFIAIVTSRSLERKNTVKKRRKGRK